LRSRLRFKRNNSGRIVGSETAASRIAALDELAENPTSQAVRDYFRIAGNKGRTLQKLLSFPPIHQPRPVN
jgi:hypothetical protein